MFISAKRKKARRSVVEPLENRRLLTTDYLQTALVSDQAGHALVQDPNLVNPWGIGLNPSTGDFWISDNGKGVATSYGGDVSGSPFVPSSLVVTIPGGAPTGQVANMTNGFAVSSGGSSGSAAFVFAGATGDITGWNSGVPLPSPSTAAQLGASVVGANFTGLAVGQAQPGAVLYAADFHNGKIDVFNSSFQPVTLSGSFSDPNIPAGFAPFNIENFNGQIVVTYAEQDAAREHAVAGPGNGFVDVFDESGNLVNRLIVGQPGASTSPLNAPWGVTLAPNNFGGFGGDLLVANAGDGHINAFDPVNGTFLGALSDPNGNLISIDGLHGIMFGNGSSSGDPNALFFTAGPNNQTHGLLGAIVSIDTDPLVAVGAAFDANAGKPFNTTIATFSDITGGNFSVTIDWGDGTTTTGAASAIGSDRYLVNGSHTYASTGSFNVTVTIGDSAANTVTANATAVVSPTGGTLPVSGVSFSDTKGIAFNGEVASFTDSDGNTSASAYTASINWGDGSTTQGAVAAVIGGFTVSGSHTYSSAGQFTVTTAVDDSDGTNGIGTATATVSNATLSATGTPVNIPEGVTFSGAVATFTDSDGNTLASAYSASIRWGDGTTTTGTVSAVAGGFQVTGSHAYGDEANDQIVVVITDSDGAKATTTASATVTEDDVLSGQLVLSGLVEGSLNTVTVATINDTDSSNVASDFTATINWGDGTTSAGVVSGSGSTFTVTGSHAYGDEGSYPVSLTFADNAPGTESLTLTGTGSVSDGDVLSPIPGNLSATEGVTFSGAVASFSDINGDAQPSGFTASIEWGDSTTTTGVVTGSNGNFTVSGTHTYADEGHCTAAVILADNSPGTATATADSSVTVLDATLSFTGTHIASTEGTTFSGTVGTFSDADSLATPSDFTATITWGDNTTTSGTVTANGTGHFNIAGQHAYAEGGPFSIHITVNDVGGSEASGFSSATIADFPLTGSTVTLSGTEGSTFTGAVATFTDTDPDGGSVDEYTTSIDWGDGTTTAGTVTGSAGSYTISGTHLFADEASGVTVTVRDAGGSTATIRSPASIADADVFTGTGLTLFTTEGQTVSGTLATFSDTYTANSASDFSATVIWGDGTTSVGAVSGGGANFTVSGSHLYADEGTESARVVLSDDAPGTATGTATAAVQVADAPLMPNAFTFNPTEASTYNGVVATFSDGNTSASASDFTASIAWGDGTTTSGTVTAMGGGAFQVVGTHVFGEEGTTSQLSVVIHDVGGSTTTASSTAVVVDAPLSLVASPISGMEQSPASFTVATFVDTGPMDPVADYSAVINWGDGTSSAGTVSLNGTTFTVTGSHTYGDEGHFTVSVTAKEVGGGTGNGQATATMLEQLLVDGTRGTPDERWVNELFHDLLGRQADMGALTLFAGLAASGNREQVIADIENSNEYRTDQVESLYEHYLHRAADPGGLAYFVSVLQSGGTVEQVATALASSPEYFADRGGGTIDGFLDALFQDALGRAVDSGARQFFDQALADGATTAQVAAIVFSSPEYLSDVVNNIYLGFLDRPADSSGLGFWSSQLAQGATDGQIIAAVTASDEYFDKTSA
jgi:uncharacterized protein (TIGR03118 family)